MKQVTVNDPYHKGLIYLLIEDMVDVAEYSVMLTGCVQETLNRLIKSNVSIDRWNHMIGRNDEGGVMNAAIVTANIKGTNPIYEIGPMADTKLRQITNDVLDGASVLVNFSGGYCPFSSDYHTITHSEEYMPVKEDTYTINENTKYINLENDPELEQRTMDYLSALDPNYSYVLKLRNYSISELTEIFEKFQDSGGEVVHVYTTGIDIPQMADYSIAIVKSGIKKVEFEFNAGQNEDHDNIIMYLEDAGVTVSVIKE